MPVRATVQEVSQLALEATEGVAVGPNRRLLGVGFNLVEAAEFDEVQPMGLLVPTAEPMRQNWSTFSTGDGSYPCYNALAYLFTMLFGSPTTTTPGGATNARQHVWTPGSTTVNRKTATISKGTPVSGGTAEQAAGAVLTDLALNFARTSAQKLTASGFAGKLDYDAAIGVNQVNVVTITGGPTGGTFTITVNGQTTAGIAYNAVASAVQSALEALSNVAPGDVTVTGSAGGPYTLTFAGALANQAITVSASGASLTGGTPAAAATTTTPGGITDIAVVPILAGQVDVFLDDTGAGLGTSKLLSDFTADFKFGGLYKPEWVLDSDLESYKEVVLQRPDATVSLELGNDATARALIPDMRAGTTKFLRLQATGGLVESGQSYALMIDAAFQINKAPAAGDQDGASTLPFDGKVVYDGTWGKWLQLTLVNGLASL